MCKFTEVGAVMGKLKKKIEIKKVAKEVMFLQEFQPAPQTKIY